MRAYSRFPVDDEEEIQPRNPTRVSAGRPPDNVVSLHRGAPLFAGLPPAPRRRKHFLISFIVQTIVFAVLIKTGVLNPPAALKEKLSTYVTLVAPSVEVYRPQPKQVLPPPPVVARARVQPPVAPPVQVTPPPPAPKPPQVAETPRPAEPPKFAKATPAPAPPKVEKKIVTGEFSSGSSAVPNSKLPTEKVQTGGFGDPSGVVPSPTGSKDSKLAKVGSFDMPSGPGTGNGTGGSHGAQAVVASAGFGNGVATMTPSKNGSGTGVHAGGFGDMQPASGPAPSRHSESAAGKLTPAEILSKPNPVYTEEARRLKIEGEVVLKVNFTVDGHIEVLSVVRGLGHGLDEAAVRAAQGMRFKPAMRDGRPVDSTATVHVLFELT